jgi:POT family proton-dependent oligopeptide transporter
VPVFTFVIYPLWGKLTKVTPLRKIGVGLFVIASSFLIVGRIEARIQAGQVVSAWWQILAYVVLTASEVLVSITALEFSYKQAPLRMKSFIMALFLLSTTVGNLMTAAVNDAMVRPLHATNVETGADTWVTLDDVSGFVTGQKIDFDGSNGVKFLKAKEPGAAMGGEGAAAGKLEPLKGTFLVAAVDETHKRVKLMDAVNRHPVETSGTFEGAKAEVSTYKLVGPEYFNFFAMVLVGVGVLFSIVALFTREKTHVREEETPAGA